MSTQLLTNPTAKPPEPPPPDPPRITEEESAVQEKDAELAAKDAKIKALESELAAVKDEVEAQVNEKRNTKPPQVNEAAPSEWQTFEASAYTAYCAEGCTGTTATGLDVSHTIYHAGKRIIAVDPSVIALGSTVEVRQADGTTFQAVANDTGGAIKGAKIDVLVANEDDAVQFGRQSVQVRLIN
ncbi:3D domain-containing protein [Bacillus sp. L381]|uniref:3D domain-containing protein n=1 Tax=Bacillus TaxID=1386 RepID=UPI001BAC81FF|nr:MULTISPECIES: 3D domain-containing protein [Bacillus]MCR9040829.1 3D domain-containing protein [Bacillus velezensis]QUN08750.1 3D domain-containing protein [Bacillus amyloliquefaciens]QYM81822.1 3D domain-containing protein [Bacillus sp. 7D3]QZY10968.1 3D domain-containing protein [Bacillus amyloliquefaciens]WIX20869.1 3D domain-containing protein [Bacillus sp. L381]